MYPNQKWFIEQVYTLITKVFIRDYAQIKSFFFPSKLKYISRNVSSPVKCQIYMLCPELQIENETLYSQVINCADNKESLELNIKELEPQKMRTFLNIWGYNILFIYQVIIIYSKSMWEQFLTLPSSVAWKPFLRYSPFNVEYLLCR